LGGARPRLQKQVDTTYDDANKQALLAKLGALYGDRLENDVAAVERGGSSSR